MATCTDLPISDPPRQVEAIRPTPKVTLSWTTAKLVPEALEVNLHVLEDERMIAWLGREKFVELCIHGTSGWQHGVSLGSGHTMSSRFLFVFCHV